MTGASSGPRRYRAATLVTGDAVLAPGWFQVEGGTVTGVGEGEPPRAGNEDLGDQELGDQGLEDEDLGEVIAVPGFVDMHVHGGGGYAYTSADPSDVRRALDFHRRHGTTTTLTSLVTADRDTLATWIRTLAPLVEAGEIAGVHLEGPWLNPVRRGAHDPRYLSMPTPAAVAELLALGGGTVKMVTLAPELPGALSAIAAVVEAGAVAAVGHTDADYDTTRAAVAAGVTVATHLFNGMPPLHHREPGPILALLDDPQVTVELIADGVHLHPAVLPYVEHTVRPERIALVTDAMPAAGMPDGRYQLGSLPVIVTGGVARLADSGSIAGSTTTMDRLFRAAAGPAPDAAALLRAVTMTSRTPARALGLVEAGRVTAGSSADVVVLTPDLHVRRVLRRGVWLDQ